MEDRIYYYHNSEYAGHRIKNDIGILNTKVKSAILLFSKFILNVIISLKRIWKFK